MAILSNINGLFAVEDNGAIKFNNLTGTNNQVLIANTGASPTWVDVDTIIGGPYLPLTGGTLAGAGNLVVGGNLTVNGSGGSVFNSTAASNHIIAAYRATNGNNVATFRTTDSGYIFRIHAQNAGTIYVQNDDGSNYLKIPDSGNNEIEGNTTFTGTISAVGASTFTLNDGIFIKAVNGTNNVAATNVWGYGLYEGASKLGEISLVRDGTGNQMYIGTTGANQVLRIGSANKVTALTLDASQNATFAGNVTLSQPTNGAEAKLTLISKSAAGNSRTGIIEYDADVEKIFFINEGSTVAAITSDAKVGIGTDSPTARLNVKASGSTVDQIAVTHSGNTVEIAQLGQSANGNSAGALLLKTNGGTDTVYLDAAGTSYINGGNFGIGTTSATTALSVSDGASMYGNSNYLVQIKRNAFQGDDNTSKASILLANKSNGMQIAYGGATDRLRFIDGGAIERFTMLNGGNIGIGVTNPSTTLQVGGGSANVLQKIWGSGTAGIQIFTNSPSTGTKIVSLEQYFSNEGYLGLYYNGTEKVRLRANDTSFFNGGKVGIGATSPGRMLHVNGGSSQDGGIKLETTATASNFWSGIEMKTPNATSFIFTSSGDSTGTIKFYPASVIKASLNASSFTHAGDIVAYGSPSDISLKENIKPIKNPLGKIKKLKGVTFDWKKSKSILDIKEDYGFIAQDVKKIVPELVRKNEDGLLSMRHQGIIPMLVEAIKELEARVKELENK